MQGEFVDAVAFGDGRQIQIDFGLRFGQRGGITRAAEGDFVYAGDARGGGNLFGRRLAADAFVGPEAPQVDQRPDGDVQRAAGQPVQAHGFGGDKTEIGGHGHGAAGVAHAVEAADFGIFAVGGHLPVHFFQQAVELFLHFLRRGGLLEAV